MQDQRIDRAEVFVVGPDVERYTWAEGMSDQYMVNIILRLTAKSGLQGIAGAAMITPHGFDRSVGETLRYLLPDVIGAVAGRARGAVAPHAQSRHAAGAAGAVADRYRAVGHDGALRPSCRSISCSAARGTRSSPMPRTPLLARQPGLYRLYRGAPGGGLQGGQVPLLVQSGARPAACARRSAKHFAGSAAWR